MECYYKDFEVVVKNTFLTVKDQDQSVEHSPLRRSLSCSSMSQPETCSGNVQGDAPFLLPLEWDSCSSSPIHQALLRDSLQPLALEGVQGMHVQDRCSGNTQSEEMKMEAAALEQNSLKLLPEATTLPCLLGRNEGSKKQGCEIAAKKSESLQTSTTLMLSNLGARYTQATLLQDLENAGFVTGMVDFLYLPFHFARRASQGYAFVNFSSADICMEFVRTYTTRTFGRFGTRLRITLADRQGKEANIDRLRRTSTKISNARYLPLVFDGIKMGPLFFQNPSHDSAP